MQDNGIHSSWLKFITEAQNNIFPIYEKHESTFDRVGIHGRMHISRALMFAEVMGRIYAKPTSPLGLDIAAIRASVAFHDSGRKDNGRDLWENDSATLCNAYLRKRETAEYASFASKLILKTSESWNINQQIMHDADVLEIMRPCCGHGGITGFHRERLKFSPPANHLEAPGQIRENLINEAWNWIQATEEQKEKFSRSTQYLLDILDFFEHQANRYPTMSVILAEP